MARKTRSEQLGDFQHKLDLSRRWRDQEGYDNLWRRLIDLYRGKHWPLTTTAQRDLIAVNLAFSTINVIAPSVSVNHPKITVKANHPGDEDRAAFVQAVINHLWRHHDFRKPFRRSVKDFLIFGHGWLKVGWRFIEQERSIGDGEREEIYDMAVEEADMFAVENPAMAGGLPTNEDIAANLPTTEMTIVEDQPFVERVSPFDMFVDPEATCMEDLTWIAQRVIRPLEEAKEDRRYSPSIRKGLTANANINPMYSDGYYEDNKNEFVSDDRVVIWEYYDIPSNTMSVFADNGEGFLVSPTPMPYAFGQPFVMIRNYDVPELFYPVGDIEPIESLQLELDKTRSQLMNDRKRYARKYLYHERSFGPEGREALESDEDGRLVPVVDENKPLSEVVVPMPQVPISNDIYAYSNIIEEDINTVSGVSEYARGAMPEIRRTATEASIIADAQNARAADKLAIVEISIGHVARKVLQLIQEFMTGEAMARVAMKGGENLYVPYTREEVLGEYDFSVEGGSTQPINDTIRKQQAVSLMNAVAPFVGTVIDPAALAMHILEEGFDIKDPAKFMVQQPATPQEQEIAGEEPLPPQGDVPMPQGVGPEMAMGPMMPPDGGSFAPTGGVPPELLLQLQNQMGLELPNL